MHLHAAPTLFDTVVTANRLDSLVERLLAAHATGQVNTDDVNGAVTDLRGSESLPECMGEADCAAEAALSRVTGSATLERHPGVFLHPRRLLGQVDGQPDHNPTKPQPDQQEDDGDCHRSLLGLAGRGPSPAGKPTVEAPLSPGNQSDNAVAATGAERLARWHELEAARSCRLAAQTELPLRRQRLLDAARMHEDSAILARTVFGPRGVPYDAAGRPQVSDHFLKALLGHHPPPEAGPHA